VLSFGVTPKKIPPEWSYPFFLFIPKSFRKQNSQFAQKNLTLLPLSPKIFLIGKFGEFFNPNLKK
jgi:hypothetical protein